MCWTAWRAAAITLSMTELGTGRDTFTSTGVAADRDSSAPLIGSCQASPRPAPEIAAFEPFPVGMCGTAGTERCSTALTIRTPRVEPVRRRMHSRYHATDELMVARLQG